jgi:hypothetical protein
MPPVVVPGMPEGVPGDALWPDGDGHLCGAPGRVYADATYLLWWTKGQQLPVIATGGSVDDSPPAALGQPSTLVLIGNSTADDAVRSGGSFTAGLWLSEGQTVGLEGGAFFLEPRSTRVVTSSDGSTVLGRPFFAVGTVTLPDGTQQDLAMEDVLLLASPGVSSGSVTVSTTSRFWGAELNGRFNLCGDCFYRADLLTGFRYLELKDNLSITSVSDTIPSSGPVTIVDTFNTVNRFYGAQVGAILDFCHGRWFLDFTGKLGLGALYRVGNVDGSTTMTANGLTVVPGGLFAQPTNIGHHAKVDFCVVPDVGCRAGCQITKYLRGYVGYSATYIARSVVQPGTLIDRSVNVNQIAALGVAPLAGDVHPNFIFRGTDWWAQGFQFGLQLDF